MRRYYSIPLLFFFLAAMLGLFLRWQFVMPTPGIRYTYFLHSHSHVMFLGWVFNVLYLSFVEKNLPEEGRGGYLKLFVILQILVVAMMISFPIQGYGLFSIIFSTLHTLAALIFIPIFFRRTKGDLRSSVWFARIAWIFFFISTAGPFSLGYLMANGMGQTVWYNYSIYFYLHFQYNGFFLFGGFSLFFQLLESKRIPFSYTRAKQIGTWMAAACVPAYALSILFSKPGTFFNILGAAGGVLQIIALIIFLKEINRIKKYLYLNFNSAVMKLFQLILLALILKLLLQLASAHPVIAEMAYDMKPVVIAYLHLVLVGIITFFLLAWYIEMELVGKAPGKLSVVILLAGFIGSEVCLVLSPWWSSTIGSGVSPAAAIFALSILMVAASLLFYLAFLQKMADKNQVLF